MIYNSFLLLSAVAPRVQLNLPAMPAWLLAGAAKRWSKQAENGTVSEFQRDVGNRLTGLGVAHATEVTTSDGNMSMDIFLPQLNISPITGQVNTPSSVSRRARTPSIFADIDSSIPTVAHFLQGTRII